MHSSAQRRAGGRRRTARLAAGRPMHRASARVDARSSRPYACHTRPVRDSLHARLRKSVRPICFPSQRKMHQASQPATTPFSRVRRAGRRSQEATVNTLTPAEHIASNPASEARLGGCRAESRVGAHSSISSAAWMGHSVHGTCSLSYRLCARFWMHMSCADSSECGVRADTISISPSRSRLPVAVASCA